MQVYVFQGTTRTFAFTRKQNGSNLPGRPHAWSPFMTVEMERGQALPGVNTELCLDDLDRYGFYIEDARIQITDK